jgi:hypothetical protein
MQKSEIAKTCKSATKTQQKRIKNALKNAVPNISTKSQASN